MIVELRYVERPEQNSDPAFNLVGGVRRIVNVLQYRQKYDIGGPYPNFQWSAWTDVPTVREAK